MLSPDVHVVTVIHSDEDCYYDELRRIGQSCNSVVCVSNYLTAKVTQRFPYLADRVHFIPHGIPIPKEPIQPRPTNGPLRLCYCNRLQQYQKRIFDLPVIASALEKLGVDYELDIAGDGPDDDELRRRFVQANLKSRIRFHGRVSNTRVLDLCRHAHIFLLTSDFEGLPISLLEAMSVGCVPVVYEIESGISDAIPNGDYGFRVSHGNVAEFALVVNDLFEDQKKLEEISNRAVDRMTNHFSTIEMAKNYQAAFTNLMNPILPFPVIRSQSIHLPKDLRLETRVLRRLKGVLKYF
jgi:glycosyltransferase involved in cell wall biosynthesis